MSILAKRSTLASELQVSEKEVDAVFTQFKVPRLGTYYHVETIRDLLSKVNKKRCASCRHWKPKSNFWDRRSCPRFIGDGDFAELLQALLCGVPGNGVSADVFKAGITEATG